jgi:hypothetical protein
MHEIDWLGWQGEDIPVVYKMVYCSSILLDDAITCDNVRSDFASASDKLARCKQVSKRSVTKSAAFAVSLVAWPFALKQALNRFFKPSPRYNNNIAAFISAGAASSRLSRGYWDGMSHCSKHERKL